MRKMSTVATAGPFEIILSVKIALPYNQDTEGLSQRYLHFLY